MPNLKTRARTRILNGMMHEYMTALETFEGTLSLDDLAAAERAWNRRRNALRYYASTDDQFNYEITHDELTDFDAAMHMEFALWRAANDAAEARYWEQHECQPGCDCYADR